MNGGGKRGTASDLGDMELVGSSILLLGRRLVLALVGKNNNSWIDVCMENEDVRVWICDLCIYPGGGRNPAAGRYQVGIEGQPRPVESHTVPRIVIGERTNAHTKQEWVMAKRARPGSVDGWMGWMMLLLTDACLSQSPMK